MTGAYSTAFADAFDVDTDECCSWPPTPPDQSVWWDVDAIVPVVLGRLRLRPGDVDQGYIAGLVAAAGEMINDFLDQCQATPTTALRDRTLVALTIELYQPDAALSSQAARNADTTIRRVDQAAIDEILHGVLAQKQRFGVA